MIHTTDNVAALHALVPGTERFIPEVGDDLQRLVQALRTVASLDLRGDRRLLGLDAANTVESLSAILTMRQAGVDTLALNTAAQDADLLVRDMHARADRLIAERAQAIAIHASVSKTRMDDAPQDVTRELRILAAAPTPTRSRSDRPGVVLGIKHLHSPRTHSPQEERRGLLTSLVQMSLRALRAPCTYGRVSGRVFACTVARDLAAAPQGAAILPEGSVVRMQRGDALLVHAQGATFADRYTPPTPAMSVSTLLVEAQDDDVEIHGPAVISIAHPEDATFLSEAHATHAFLTAVQKTAIAESPGNHIGRPLALWLGFSAGFAGMAALPIVILPTLIIPDHTPSPQNVEFLTAVMAGVAVVCTALGIWAFLAARGRYKAWKVAQAAVATLVAQQPHSSRTGTITQRAAAFLQRYTGVLSSRQAGDADVLMVKGHKRMIPGHLPVLHTLFGRAIRTGDGLNIAPPDTIQALHEHDVAVMQPFLALPAPSPIDQVVIPMRARATA